MEGMAKYIWTILKSQPDVVMSWGLDMETIIPVHNGLWFHVKGFKFEGTVKVALDEGTDLFEIHLIDDSGREQNVTDSVYLDTLVSTIDELVEHTEDYEKKVCEKYSIL